MSKVFANPDNGTDQVHALENVSLEVQAGEFFSIIGPSGCGKSTLFNIIGGLVGEYEGRVIVEGAAVTGTHPAIGMVFQEESTFPWRTVIENVAFPLEIIGVAKAERIERARHFVDLVGLNGFERRYPAELSGGMRQRVAICRALVTDPDILLMDEPFSALDAMTRDEMNDALLDIWDRYRKTGLFVTHSIREAVYLADRVVVMTSVPGRIKQIFPIKLPEARDRFAPEFTQYESDITRVVKEEVAKVRE